MSHFLFCFLSFQTYRTHDPAVLTKFNRGGRHSVGPTPDGPSPEVPLYSTLEHVSSRDSPLPPPPPFNHSPDHDLNHPLLNAMHHRNQSIGSDMLDGGDSRNVESPAESYQIRLSADSAKFYRSPPGESSSDNHSFSRLTSPSVLTHPTSRSSSDGSPRPAINVGVLSATNPMTGDYEQIDHIRGYNRGPGPDGSGGNMRGFRHTSSAGSRPIMMRHSETGSSSNATMSTTLSSSAVFAVQEEEEKFRRISTNSIVKPDVTRKNSSTVGGFNRSRSTSNASPVSDAYDRNRSQSITKIPLHQQNSRPLHEEKTDGDSRDSRCSEGLPPYSSRPPSIMTNSTSSMIGNDAYEPRELTENEEATSPRPWYQTNSDMSLNSNTHREFNNHTPHSTTQERNPIPPYAMIHNSAIPITHAGPLGTSAPNSIQTMSTTRKPVQFVIGGNASRDYPQPYSEPITSSIDTLSSVGHARQSPNFQTVAV